MLLFSPFSPGPPPSSSLLLHSKAKERGCLLVLAVSTDSLHPLLHFSSSFFFVRFQGAALANFGKFTVSTGPSGKTSPVFVLNEQFARRYGIHTEVILKRKLEPIEDINYSRIAFQFSKQLSKDLVQTCLKHLLNQISSKISSGISLKLNFGFGVLSAHSMKVVFKFGGGGYTTLSAAAAKQASSSSSSVSAVAAHTSSELGGGGKEGAGGSSSSTNTVDLSSLSLSGKPKIIPEEYDSIVSKDAYLRHLKSEKALKKKEKSLDKYNLTRRKQLDKQAKTVVKQKDEDNRQVQEYLKAQIAEKEERARKEKEDSFHAENTVPLYPAEISCFSPQDVRKRKEEYKQFLEQQMLEKQSMKNAARKMELSQDWELLNVSTAPTPHPPPKSLSLALTNITERKRGCMYRKIYVYI